MARDRATLTALHALIRQSGMHKTYLALVSGSWQLGTKRIDAPLATDNRQHGERHVRVAAAGKESVSVFKPVQFFGKLATLMEVDIPTGRTHQIRVHAAFAGHPLLGDDKYGDRERNAELKRHGLKRIFLHAQSIAFDWPGSGVPFHVSAPLPAELAAVLDAITTVKRRPAKRARRRAGKSARKSSRNLEADPAQHRAQPDQRQPDERARIGAVDGFAQADPEALALEAAGAVDGRLARDITRDRGLIEQAERDAGGIHEFDGAIVALAHHGDGGQKRQRAARAAAQLLDAARLGAGLAENGFAAGAVRQAGGLIGADDAGLRGSCAATARALARASLATRAIPGSWSRRVSSTPGAAH